jgi:hypothetical protein
MRLFVWLGHVVWLYFLFRRQIPLMPVWLYWRRASVA